MQRFLAGRIMGFGVAIATLAGITYFYRHLQVNQTTVALSFLLAILAVSAVWGMAVSVFTSVVAMLSFNYFFLPPVGTFTIGDSRNWVSLAAFTVVAMAVSAIAELARASAVESERRRGEADLAAERRRMVA